MRETAVGALRGGGQGIEWRGGYIVLWLARDKRRTLLIIAGETYPTRLWCIMVRAPRPHP